MEAARGMAEPVGGQHTVSPENCPEPFWHDTHRYCPACSWIHPDTAAAQIEAQSSLFRAVLEALCQQRGWNVDDLKTGDYDGPPRNYELMIALGIGHLVGIAAPLTCGDCGRVPEEHADSDAGPMSVCPQPAARPLSPLPVPPDRPAPAPQEEP